MASIHPSAIVDSNAQIGEKVQIGPYAIIGPNVRIGEGCSVGSHTVKIGRAHV